MPLPKVPNGQKISLMLPAELVRRIKLEALDTGSLPAGIVQKALEAYWGTQGGDPPEPPARQAEGPPTGSTGGPLPLRQMKQVTVMDAMFAQGRFTEQEFLAALGKTPGALRAAWIQHKSGTMTEVLKLEKFISSKCESRQAYLDLLEATRVPGPDSPPPPLR
jgi:hypothetical protein